MHEPGLYKVKWVASKDRSGTVEGSERFFAGGDRVGFQRTQEGMLVAIAGKEEFPLEAAVPQDARRVVWYTKREYPSDLTKTTGAVLNGTGSSMVVGNVLVGAAALAGAANEADYDRDEYQQHHHHHHHHHHHRY